MASSVSPLAMRALKAGVFACSSASDSFSIVGSSALISRTVFWYCLSSRWLRLPKIWVSNDMLEFLKKRRQKSSVGEKRLTARSSTMAKDDDFIMRRRLHRVIDHSNNSAHNNNPSQPKYLTRDEKKIAPPRPPRRRSRLRLCYVSPHAIQLFQHQPEAPHRRRRHRLPAPRRQAGRPAAGHRAHGHAAKGLCSGAAIHVPVLQNPGV